MRASIYGAAVGFLLTTLFNPSLAAFELDSSCPTSVSDAYREALAMANTAFSGLDKKDTRDSSDQRGLFQILFDEKDRDGVKDIFSKIARLSFSTTIIKFYCNEDTIHWPGTDASKATDKTTAFFHSGFKDGQNDASQELGIESNVKLPRQTLCEQGNIAYAINGLGGTPDLSNQVHIILCPSAVQPDNTKDRRSVAKIKAEGLDKNFNALTNIDPLSVTIIHELTHTTPVGGIDANSASNILDGPNADTYGFAKCVELRKADSRAPAKAAEPYAFLALGLSLQFQDKFKGFTWSLGVVNVDNGRTNYAPYFPPRSTKSNPTPDPTPKLLLRSEMRQEQNWMDVMKRKSKRSLVGVEGWMLGGVSEWRKWRA